MLGGGAGGGKFPESIIAGIDVLARTVGRLGFMGGIGGGGTCPGVVTGTAVEVVIAIAIVLESIGMELARIATLSFRIVL